MGSIKTILHLQSHPHRYRLHRLSGRLLPPARRVHRPGARPDRGDRRPIAEGAVPLDLRDHRPLSALPPAGAARADRALPALARAGPHRRRGDAVQPHAAAQCRADAPQPLSAPRAARRVRAHGRVRRCRTTSTASPGSSPTCSPTLGVWFYTAAVNPIRGARPKPFPGAFWWEGPERQKVLAWNGYHYLFGRSQAGLGNWDFVDRLLPRWVEQLEADDELSLRLPLLRIDPSDAGRQRPAGSAHARLRRAVERRGPALQMAFVTVDRVRPACSRPATATPSARSAATGSTGGPTAPPPAPTRPASTAPTHEIVGCGRGDRSLAPQRRASGTGMRRRAADTYENDDALRRAHLGRLFLDRGAALALHPGPMEPQGGLRLQGGDGGARPARPRRQHARRTARHEGAGGDVQPRRPQAGGGVQAVGHRRGAGDQHASLGAQGHRRGAGAARRRRPGRHPRLLLQPRQRLGRHRGRSRRSAASPARCRQWVTPSSRSQRRTASRPQGRRRARSRTATTGCGSIRRPAACRVLRQGSGPRFRRRTTRAGGSGSTSTRRSNSPRGPARHRQLRLLPARFLHRPQGHALAARAARQRSPSGIPRSTRGAPRSLSTSRRPVSARRVVTYALDAGTKALSVDWMLDKLHNTDAEAVFVAFPFKLDGQRLHHRPQRHPRQCRTRDQLDGAAKDWYPLRRWVDVSDGKRGVTLVPLDAPLVHLGGITTGKWSRTLEPEGPTIMSWALNNHWMVNFKAEPGRQDPAPLPADDARRSGRPSCGGALRRRSRASRLSCSATSRSTGGAGAVLLPSRQRRPGHGHHKAGRGRGLGRGAAPEPLGEAGKCGDRLRPGAEVGEAERPHRARGTGHQARRRKPDGAARSARDRDGAREVWELRSDGSVLGRATGNCNEPIMEES